MAIATHTLTGDLSALVGEHNKVKATIHTNSEDGSWVNETDSVIRLGGAVVYNTRTGGDGKFTVVVPTSTGTGLQYEVRVEYIDESEVRHPQKTWASGWFDMTANRDLAERANNSTLRINPSLGAQLTERIVALENDGATGEALEELADRLDGVNDHGNVSGTLTLDPANGFHVFDATGPLEISLGDPPGYSVAFKAITGADDVTIDGLPDLELTDDAWATFVHYRSSWHLAASGASGGGDVEPVIDPPTQPGAVTVDPTADGYNLSWVASTVAAGYEVQIDGEGWVDSGANLTHPYTDLAPGSSHSGAVRAYNTPGARSNSRAWGPSSTLLPGLHEQLLAYNAPLYIRANNGAFEDLSSVERTWNLNYFTDPGGFGGTPVTFDGPAVANVPESMKFNYRSTMRSKDGDFQDFADMTEFTAVMLLSGEYPVPAVQLHDGFTLGANRGTLGNEAMGPDTTIEHLLVWRWTEATGRQFWRDGVLTVFDGYSVSSGPVGVGDSDNRGLWIGATNKSFSPPPDFTRVAPFVFAIPQALTDAEIVALAQAAGTFGNPR